MTTDIDFCVGPLVHTDTYNSISKEGGQLAGCGLACSTGSAFYGISEDQQDFIDWFKIAGCTFCFVTLVYLVVHQYLDGRKSGKKFTDKPILQIVPYLLTFSLFGTVFLMTIGEITGKEAIVCSKHDYDKQAYPHEDEYEASEYNPKHGKNAVCTIHGALFYGCLLMYMFYTVLLSFIIFRSVFAPLNPLWKIRQRYWHLGVFALMIIFEIIPLSLDSITGIYPMGVCMVASGGKDRILALVCIPCTVCSCASAALIFAAGYYLFQDLSQQRGIMNDRALHKIEDLLKRIILYAIAMLVALILTTVTTFVFYFKADSLNESMYESIDCQLGQILLMQNLEVDCYAQQKTRMAPYFFISWVVSAMLGALAQVILSCNMEARDRIRRSVSKGSSKGNSRDSSRMKYALSQPE